MPISQEPYAHPPSKSAHTVLVVDDDPAARDLIERTLRKAGYGTRSASNGQDAIRLARELHPFAVTLDVMMPGIDGWSILGQMKADPELADTPVIMISMVEDRDLGYALGASDYLTKPIDSNRLINLLKRYVCGHPPCRALVVEDDPDSRALLATLLQKEGWIVSEAGDGLEATARLAEDLPQLIILDLLMPRMDGFELVALLQAKPEWRKIPIVVMTAKDVTDEDRQRLNGQVAKIIPKAALDRTTLVSEIAQAITARTQASSTAN